MTREIQKCKLKFLKIYGWRPGGAKMAPFSHILAIFHHFCLISPSKTNNIVPLIT